MILVIMILVTLENEPPWHCPVVSHPNKLTEQIDMPLRNQRNNFQSNAFSIRLHTHPLYGCV